MLETILTVIHYSILLINVIQEDTSSDFQDLGKLLFGGFVLAIGVAIAFVFVRLRLRDKKEPGAEFISISSIRQKE